MAIGALIGESPAISESSEVVPGRPEVSGQSLSCPIGFKKIRQCELLL